MGRESRTDQDSDRVSYLFGIACGVAAGAFAFSLFGDRYMKHHAVIAGAVGVVGLVGLVVSSIRHRIWLGVAVPLALVPLVTGVAAGLSGRHVAVAHALEASSFVIVFSVAVVAGLFYSHGFRELERLLFREASSAAFFVTIVASAVYGLAQQLMHLPRLSLAWVSIFGLLAWAVLSWVFEKRYS